MYITNFCSFRNHTITSAQERRQLAEEVPERSCDEWYDLLGLAYPRFHKMDLQSKLGFLASEVVLKEQGVEAYPPDSVAVVLSNSKASLDTDQKFEASIKSMASPSLFVYTLPNIVTGEICIRHGLTGENAFFITPAFDATLLAEYTDLVLAQAHVHACIGGWIDVLDDYYDVFLYLVEKKKNGLSVAHHAEALEKLYNQ